MSAQLFHLVQGCSCFHPWWSWTLFQASSFHLIKTLKWVISSPPFPPFLTFIPVKWLAQVVFCLWQHVVGDQRTQPSWGPPETHNGHSLEMWCACSHFNSVLCHPSEFESFSCLTTTLSHPTYSLLNLTDRTRCVLWWVSGQRRLGIRPETSMHRDYVEVIWIFIMNDSLAIRWYEGL